MAWRIAVPLAFLALMLFFFPFREKLEYDKDEGINLMKSMLVVKGFSLYDQIWSDQPPLFTYMLAGVFQMLGLKVNAARFFVLLLSGALLWAVFEWLRLVWGKVHALTGALLLLLLPRYAELSVSAMVGLPAIAFAMLSLLALTVWHQQRNILWLILSGIALGLSVLTKIFTGFLAPILILGLLIGEYSSLQEKTDWYAHLRPAAIWLASFGLFTALLGLLLVGHGNLEQLIGSHLGGSAVFQEARYSINQHLKEAWAIFPLALAGVIFILIDRRWLSIYPLTWMVMAYALLAQHAPVWYHHQLLITIPAAMLGAIAVGQALGRVYRAVRFHSFTGAVGLLAILTLGSFGLFLVLRAPQTRSQFRPNPASRNAELNVSMAKLKFLQYMNEYASQTNWVVTDVPMYAFRVGKPVPPSLAVFSTKRLRTGNLTEDDILQAVKEYQPEQVLLGRFNFPALETYLTEHYRLAFSRLDMELYIRNDL